MGWIDAHFLFAVEFFSKISESVIIAQSAFSAHFMLR